VRLEQNFENRRIERSRCSIAFCVAHGHSATPDQDRRFCCVTPELFSLTCELRVSFHRSLRLRLPEIGLVKVETFSRCFCNKYPILCGHVLADHNQGQGSCLVGKVFSVIPSAHSHATRHCLACSEKLSRNTKSISMSGLNSS
jgi:hypothetical protein